VGNLLANAVKFTPRGGRVHVAVTLEDGAAVLTVEDTGVGIPPEDLPHVFNRFRQSQRAERRQSGLGLGLWLVRKIVEAHGGSVAAASQGDGFGSIFTARLPLEGAAITASGEQHPRTAS
jgi:signal transduction histidine kinase